MIGALSVVVLLSSSSYSLTLARESGCVFIRRTLFACKFVCRFFPLNEMSHKKRRESTKTPGEDRGFSFLRNHPEELRFFTIYIYITRI